MKHCLVTLAALLVAASAYAQGTVNFNNRVPPGLDARITLDGGGNPGSAYVAQLYAAAPGGQLAAVGAPIPFRDTPEAGKGYWVGETRTIPGVAENGTAHVKVVAWATALGATFEAAQAAGQGGWGQSAEFDITTGGGLNPPGILTGLTSFAISTAVPEPAIAALGVLGAGLLLIRRKK